MSTRMIDWVFDALGLLVTCGLALLSLVMVGAAIMRPDPALIFGAVVMLAATVWIGWISWKAYRITPLTRRGKRARGVERA